jgi:hypothetical protein
MRTILRILPLAIIGLLAIPTFGFAGSAPQIDHIKAAGHLSFSQNQYFKDGQHYTPGVSVVSHNGKLVITNKTKEDHTFSLVPRSQVPSTIKEANACYGRNGACNAILDSHGFNDNDPSNDRLKVNKGKPGFDRSGDSVGLRRGKTVVEKISAPAGRNLYFMCVFHPQMQGRVGVR